MEAILECSRPKVVLNRLWRSPYHGVWGKPFIPLAKPTTRPRQFSTQWRANPRVFPGFDLSLLARENAEPGKTYEPKAIHTYPVGEEEGALNDRYQIFTKMGYGPTATVWLALDMGKADAQFVVLKIYVVQHKLRTYEKLIPPKKYPRSEYPYRKVLDKFEITGPEGKHICVVHEAPPLDPYQFHKGDKLSVNEMRETMRQQLILLDYLHTGCNTTARVDPIMYKEAYPMADTESDKLTESLLPGDGMPLLADCADADYEAGLIHKHARSPEEILRSPLDFKVDTWAAAVTAWDYVSSRNLISGRNEEGAFDDRVHVAELVALIGPPSPEYRNKMPLGSIFWDEKGQWTGQVPIPDRKLEDLALGEADGEDLSGFLQWMRKALQWDPADRPTALGLMRHEWMAQEPSAEEEAAGESPECASAQSSSS
ncbi:unnamed protein product [Penicillium salamii]|nr:unnamed protein product [Penicillium salamii]